MKTQEELIEEHKKQLIAAHAIWLENPTTQLFLKFLGDREKKYTKDLTDKILIISDKESEDKSRAAINTCKAIFQVASNSTIFVDQTTKPQ